MQMSITVSPIEMFKGQMVNGSTGWFGVGIVSSHRLETHPEIISAVGVENYVEDYVADELSGEYVSPFNLTDFVATDSCDSYASSPLKWEQFDEYMGLVRHGNMPVAFIMVRVKTDDYLPEKER